MNKPNNNAIDGIPVHCLISWPSKKQPSKKRVFCQLTHQSFHLSYLNKWNVYLAFSENGDWLSISIITIEVICWRHQPLVGKERWYSCTFLYLDASNWLHVESAANSFIFISLRKLMQGDIASLMCVCVCVSLSL